MGDVRSRIGAAEIMMLSTGSLVLPTLGRRLLTFPEGHIYPPDHISFFPPFIHLSIHQLLLRAQRVHKRYDFHPHDNDVGDIHGCG